MQHLIIGVQMPQARSKRIRNRYFRLLSRGMTTTAACETVGINRRTGLEWRQEARGIKRERTKPKLVEESIGGGGSRLSLDDRLCIADMAIFRTTCQEIAEAVGCSVSTISRELRLGTIDGKYRPRRAHEMAKARRSRPKPTKIGSNGELRDFIEVELMNWLSPEQIVQKLRQTYPERLEMCVVHETIYQALYVQGRGELRRELALCLRTGRAKRKKQRRADERTPRFIDDMVMISERPAEADDRAIPGHWEGDLIIGKDHQSAIGTLVERSTRYVMLVHLSEGRTGEAMAKALTTTIQRLPEQLKRSLAWDQGSEMSQHKAFTMETGMPVYFCDPARPWQRGSNENTNGLLRQYFPKGTDLSVHTRDDLDWVEMSLNNRIRKTLDWSSPGHRLASLIDQFN